jgi:hypothetical protein
MTPNLSNRGLVQQGRALIGRVFSNSRREHPRTIQPRPEFSDFLQDARKLFKAAAEADFRIRQEALEDLKFYAGEQWRPEDETSRRMAGRPCLIINRLPAMLKQVLNEQRQSRPSIQINPVGDGADVDLAEIMQGLVRHIETQSNADVAYDTAFEQTVIHGRGYARIYSDYPDSHSTRQEIYIKRILDTFAVYMDPNFEEADGSDAEFCFIVEQMPRDVFKRKYPDSDVAGLADFRSIGDGEKDWFENGTIRVAEYFRREHKTRTLVTLTNGKGVFEDELPEDAEIATDEKGEPVTRESDDISVVWSKINAIEKLEKDRVMPCQRIPVIPFLGDELVVDGKRKVWGMVRFAKDPQRFYNWARTGVVENLALSSRSPYLIPDGQIEDFEEDWRLSNISNSPVLSYRYREDSTGRPLPPPTRNQYEPPIAGLVESLRESADDLQATTGVNSAVIGQQEPGESGRSRLLRLKQGETANSNYIDNQARGIRRVGQDLIDWIPAIYDTPMVQRIVNPDGTHRMVPLNQWFRDKGTNKIYDLSIGRFDCVASMGQSYQTRRKEFVDSVLSLVQAVPQVAQFVLDLLIRNMDWPHAKEIADRLKKMLPPQLQDPEEGDPNALPPEAQSKIATLMQQNAQLVAALNKSTSIQEQKLLEMESKERIAALKAYVDLLGADLKAKQGNAQFLAEQGFQHIDRRLQLLKDFETLGQDAADNAGAPAAGSPPGAPAAPPAGAPPAVPASPQSGSAPLASLAGGPNQ